MRQLENTLIDNSFEDRTIDNLDYNRNFDFEEIIKKYTEYFISKRQNMLFSYPVIRNFERAYITNQEILDRNIFILKSKILFNKSNREIADKCNICSTTVQTLYTNVLKDLKHIIKK
jgi:hypothetical protein